MAQRTPIDFILQEFRATLAKEHPHLNSPTLMQRFEQLARASWLAGNLSRWTPLDHEAAATVALSAAGIPSSTEVSSPWLGDFKEV